MFDRKHLRRIILFIVFFLFIEIFVFNFRALQSWNYREEILSGWQVYGNLKVDSYGNLFHNEKALIDSSYSGDTYIQQFINTEYGSGIYLEEIDKEIKNLYVNIEVNAEKGQEELNTDANYMLGITYNDEGNAKLSFQERVYVINNDIESSKYIKLNPYGDISRIVLSFSSHLDDVTYTINRISINRPVPFDISVGRLVVYTVLYIIIYILLPSSDLWKLKIRESNLFTKSVSYIECFVICILILVNISISAYMHLTPVHGQYYQLAEALVNGHTYLDELPSDIVTGAKNPYDVTERCSLVAEKYGGDYSLNKYADAEISDKAYYNGKYYVYFGIVPCLMFHLPFYLLTGGSFPNWIAVFIGCILIAIFINKLLLVINSEYKLQMSYASYLLLSISLQCVMGMQYVWHYPSFYMVPIVWALTFVLIGIYCWYKATVKAESICNSYLLLGSICMGLVAGCRPQFLVGLFFVIPIFLCREQRQKITKFNIFIFILPLLVIGLALMYYNYIRFDSPFDFGAMYNITSNDMTRRGIRLDRIGLAVFSYWFQLPRILSVFPFIYPVETLTQYVGVLIKEDLFGGILVSNVVCWFLIGIFDLWSDLKKHKLRLFILLCLGLSLFVSIVDAEMSGLLYRYVLVFGWLLIFPLVFIISMLLQKYNSNKLKLAFLIAVLITTLYALLTYMSMSTLPMYNWSSAFFIHVKDLIVFWD